MESSRKKRRFQAPFTSKIAVAELEPHEMRPRFQKPCTEGPEIPRGYIRRSRIRLTGRWHTACEMHSTRGGKGSRHMTKANNNNGVANGIYTLNWVISQNQRALFLVETTR